jgi:hypothetical protein
MSANEQPSPVPDDAPDGWSDLTDEERAELRRDFDEAREDMRNGVRGIPLDEVLPRYRQTG